MIVIVLIYKMTSFRYTCKRNFGKGDNIVKKIILIIMAAAIAVLTAGCAADSGEENKDGKLSIYTSIYPLEYLAETIGKDHVDVQSIYPPGVDAHTYEPTSREMTQIARADLFIYMGAGMEGFSESAAEALKNQKTTLVEIGKDHELFEHHEVLEKHEDHKHGDEDPHIWLDPLKMIKMGERIEESLIKQDPDHKADYEKNFQSMKSKMQDLDQTFAKTVQAGKQKSILVSHAAYGYWERYGIQQISISGLSTTDEPSQKDLARIARLAKEKHLNYVIFERNAADHKAELLQKHIHAKPLYIHNLEVRTDQDKKQKADYLSLMKENLEVLKKATK